MRRLPIALALATTLLMGLTATPSAAAARLQPVGERLDLRDGDQDFPASTPFHINHGFLFVSSDNRIGLKNFVLDMDGSPLTADFILWSRVGGDFTVDEQWYYNFPSGLTGVHEFTRHYLEACDNVVIDCEGNPIHTLMETFTASAVVTFTP
jgi:hypothetical protein